MSASVGRRAAEQKSRDERAEYRRALGVEDDAERPITTEDIRREAEMRNDISRDSYRPSLTSRDMASLETGEWAPDWRRVSLGRIFYVDLPQATRKYCSGFTKDERESLRTDALLLLIRWEAHGDESPFPLGGAEREPYRRDWIEPETGRPTSGAWRAMRAALKQAAEGAALRALQAAGEMEAPAEDISLGRAAVAEDGPSLCTLPDEDAPELLSEAMGISLKAARALVYTGWRMSPESASALWGVTPKSATQTVSRGRAELAAIYPEPRELLRALSDAAPTLRAMMAERAAWALREWRNGSDTRARAERETAAWMSYRRSAAPEMEALEAAVRRAQRRAWGASPEGEAETVASSIARLYGAERARARKLAETAGRGNGSGPGTRDMSGRETMRTSGDWQGGRYSIAALACPPPSARRR